MFFPWTCTKFWFASYRSCFSSVSPENVQYFSWVLDANIVLFKDNGLKPGSFPLWPQALFLTWLCALPPDAKSCVFLTRDRKHISQLAYATRPFTVLLLFLFYLLEAYAVLGVGESCSAFGLYSNVEKKKSGLGEKKEKKWRRKKPWCNTKK